MYKLNLVVDVLNEEETSAHQRSAQHHPRENCLRPLLVLVLTIIDNLVKPDMLGDMLDVAIANINGWGLHNHNKLGAPCDRCETAVALPRGVDTDLKREVRVATGRNEKKEKNEKCKKRKIKCAATGTEQNIDRSCYGSVGSTTSCAASATRFDPTMKGKAKVEFKLQEIDFLNCFSINFCFFFYIYYFNSRI